MLAKRQTFPLAPDSNSARMIRVTRGDFSAYGPIALWLRRSCPMTLRLLIIVSLAAALTTPTMASPATPTPIPTDADVRVLLADWTGSYGGQLPFDRVKVAAFTPALEAAMAQKLTEIDAIAGNPAPPTFENTLAAMERAGKPLNRVLDALWCLDKQP